MTEWSTVRVKKDVLRRLVVHRASLELVDGKRRSLNDVIEALLNEP